MVTSQLGLLTNGRSSLLPGPTKAIWFFFSLYDKT